MDPWIREEDFWVSIYMVSLGFFIFTVDVWIAIVDTRRRWRDIVREGVYLLSTMLNQAIQIKCLEAIFCGSFVRMAQARFFGKLFVAVSSISCWDLFYGRLVVCVLEMAFTRNCGIALDLTSHGNSLFETLFIEELGFVLKVSRQTWSVGMTLDLSNPCKPCHHGIWAHSGDHWDL